MTPLYFMMTIAERKKLSEIVSVCSDNHIHTEFITLGYSTAGREILSYLGIGSTEKAILFSMVTEETWKRVKKGLEQKIKIDIPGTGIAFIIPVSSVGGKRELSFLLNGQKYSKGDESILKGTERELIIAICEQGQSEAVMSAARECGAGGGTTIHATGTGMNSAEKFLGITLASEKDVVLIVAKSSEKTPIMNSIMKNAGPGTEAKAITFSLPVTDTAGLRLTESE